jgi:hypothetical protein
MKQKEVNECSKIINASQCLTEEVRDLGLNCFWLYSGSDETDGSCKWKNDTNIKCSDAKIEDQCTKSSDIENLGDDKCFWIIKNESNILNPSVYCVDVVCFFFFNYFNNIY